MSKTIVVCLLIIVSGCDRRASLLRSLEEREQAKVAENEPKILELRAALASHPIFARTGTRADAAVVLGAIVPYGRSSTSALSLPEPIIDALGGSGWVANSAAINTASLDFSWMRGLAELDHWRALRDPRWAGAPPFSFLHAAAPNWFILSRWAKLRLLDGLRRGELPAARG